MVSNGRCRQTTSMDADWARIPAGAGRNLAAPLRRAGDRPTSFVTGRPMHHSPGRGLITSSRNSLVRQFGMVHVLRAPTDDADPTSTIRKETPVGGGHETHAFPRAASVMRLNLVTGGVGQDPVGGLGPDEEWQRSFQPSKGAHGADELLFAVEGIWSRTASTTPASAGFPPL